MTIALTPDHYLALVGDDTKRLLAVAERGVDAPVPSCPGWTVADLLDHVSHVYEHKVRVMAANAWPEDWPPPELAGREPLGFLREAAEHLFAEFEAHQPTEPTTTFGDDSTITFWMRRMALEIAVHRLDGELAHDDPTPVDADLALDGVDEFLRVMLAGSWGEGESKHPVEAVVAVETGGRRWVCDARAEEVTVDKADPGNGGEGDEGGGDEDTVAATVFGDPEAVFLWLWGRAADDKVQRQGDDVVLAAFRGRLAEAAQ